MDLECVTTTLTFYYVGETPFQNVRKFLNLYLNGILGY